MLKQKLFPETLRSLAFGAIGANYAAIGTAFNNPIRILKIQNLTDATLLFSFDGAADHDILPSGGFMLLDIASNKEYENVFCIPIGALIYVKRSGVPTTGSVYITSFYGV